MSIESLALVDREENNYLIYVFMISDRASIHMHCLVLLDRFV